MKSHWIVMAGLAAMPAGPVSGVPRELLDSLLRSGLVELRAFGSGGHAGEVLSVEAFNPQARSLRLVIPPGWRFASQDSAVQDLLVVEESVLVLAPRASGAVRCRVFCCEASKSGPQAGSVYLAGGPADGRLVQLARHLSAHRYPDQAVQQAVWSVSDGHPISAIDGGDAGSTLALRRLVADVTGQSVPWYTTAYAVPEPGRLFSNEPVSVSGTVEFQQRHPGLLSIVVKDAAGRTVRVIEDGRVLEKGRFTIEVAMTVRGWPKGRYSLLFATDGVLRERQSFDL
ncbi:MAG: hypothetical protein QY325_15680 [Flavobacteriales bacterium]|nr:MAG: hypothetical protein QY325_15680 [Flavobacteriales bacterium]